jgi:pimeloyl-ACP methyl ester carboxylesterase
MRSVFFLIAIGLACVPLARADEAAPQTDVSESVDEPSPLPTIELHDFLVLPAVGHYGRLPVHRDAVEAQLVAGEWSTPRAGDAVSVPGGQAKTWRAATAEEGVLETRTIRGGYAFTKFHSPVERVMLLDAAGHAAVYVNGELRTGDPYSLGWLRLPVLVREGENTLLFHVADDRLAARLTAPPGDVFFMGEDRTLPTLVRGEVETAWGAVPIVNASRDWLRNARIECGPAASEELESTPVPSVAPLSVAKIPFQMPAASGDTENRVDFQVRLKRDSDDESLAETEIALKVAGPSEVHVRTFRSQIDGSLQPYAVRPASAPSPADGTEAHDLPGIVVTLHGADVDCETQAARYSAKSWAHVVAPQGRGKYGFDWEDWGRIDFLEALADARQRYPSNPRRTYLTGQSMGGHGVWHLSVTYPDLFAAIGPSAAWASFWSYGGGMPTFQNPTPLEALVLRSYSVSDTVQLLANLAEVGVYVLHGGADEIVPVAQARFMRSRLAGFHTNFAYYEDPVDEHAPGGVADDWSPMMEFFERLERPLPESRTIVDFATANPGVSSRCDWLTIEAQQLPLTICRAVIRQDADTRTFVGQTTNVARLAIDVAHLAPGQPIDVTLDGQQLQWIPWPEDVPTLWFARMANEWEVAARPSPHEKGPERSGSFKSAFNHEALLVYGTGGTEEEDRWALTKARYDAETFWYRGNGHFEIVPDTEFDPTSTIGQSVILYGNADTNAAWTSLVGDCPVQVRRGEIRVGDRTERGEDLALLMIYPRADSDAATVGVVAGTGPIGMALTNRLRYFVSGIAYPDLMIVDSAGLVDGMSGIRAWGYFDSDWTTDSGEIVWRDSQ